MRGETTDNCDIDIIIISSDFGGKDVFERAKMTMASEMATIKKFMWPLDILMMTPEEYAVSSARGYYHSKIVV